MSSALDTLIESYTSTNGIYWALEDNSGTTSAADLSGNGHQLTCAKFATNSNGTSSYAPALSAVSIGAVINYTSGSFIARNVSGNYGGQLYVSAGKPYCSFGNGSAVTYVNSPTAMTSGHTYLLIATWNGTTITLYQYDLTAGISQTPVTGSLSGSFAPSTSWGVGENGLTATLGRIFVLPVALT